MPFDRDFVDMRTRDGRNVILLSPLTFTTHAGERIEVPCGTQSDGASTPSALWPTIPPFGEYWKAAILHDYLYRETEYPKYKCDSIFLEAMLDCKVEPTLAKTIYEGVHVGGWKAFREDRVNG